MDRELALGKLGTHYRLLNCVKTALFFALDSSWTCARMGMFKLETEILVKRVLAPHAQFQQSQAIWMRWTTQEKSSRRTCHMIIQIQVRSEAQRTRCGVGDWVASNLAANAAVSLNTHKTITQGLLFVALLAYMLTPESSMIGGLFESNCTWVFLLNGMP